MRTVCEWIDWATERLDEAELYYGHGTESSRDEALWLVSHALGKSPQSAFDNRDELPEAPVTQEIRRLVSERIKRRCPAAYLTGSAWFAGLEFEVNTDVLVPRSPLAELITDGFSPWLNTKPPKSILDLGTGSGCIAIACAIRFQSAKVDAADISEAALAVARRNVERHELGDRVKLVHSDLYDSLGGRKYDLIVSNPPYVPERSLRTLPDEYRAEPEVGLVSGLEGLEIPIRILQGAAQFLSRDGVLVCEVGESQQRLQEALSQVPFLWLDFEMGGEGVFLLEGEQVIEAGKAATELLKDQ